MKHIIIQHVEKGIRQTQVYGTVHTVKTLTEAQVALEGAHDSALNKVISFITDFIISQNEVIQA